MCRYLTEIPLRLWYFEVEGNSGSLSLMLNRVYDFFHPTRIPCFPTVCQTKPEFHRISSMVWLHALVASNPNRPHAILDVANVVTAGCLFIFGSQKVRVSILWLFGIGRPCDTLSRVSRASYKRGVGVKSLRDCIERWNFMWLMYLVVWSFKAGLLKRSEMAPSVVVSTCYSCLDYYMSIKDLTPHEDVGCS